VLAPSKSPQRIAQMFDAIAGRYDFLNHLLSGGIDRRWRRRAIRALTLGDRDRVLDLCTGTGDLAIEAVQAGPDAVRAIGVDFAGAMLRIGLEKIRRIGLDRRIALVRGDATRIPLADGTVDAITIAFGIRNVDDVTAACREMRRVLKPGGRVAVLEFSVPTRPLIGSAYLWYLHRVLPRIGRMISRHRDAYRYLSDSIDAFAVPAEFVKILRHAGFSEVDAVPLTFGTVCLYVARRP
jgi:demethylmenaquinone methyltransferase / 2-methoxy-6-polyprenyl-1,4-benzoquinol methylase